MGLLGTWFSFQCHQAPERSFALGSTYFPVCVRCAGVYLGLAVSALAPAIRAKFLGTRRALYLALFAMAGSWGLEHFAQLAIPACVRALAGLLFGVTVGMRARAIVSELGGVPRC